MAPLDRTYRLNAKLDFENNASAEIATVSAELTALNQKIESLDNNVNIKFDADTTSASAKINELKREISEVSGGTARLTVNTRPAHDSIDRLERRLIAFAARTYTTTMQVNVDGMARLAALQTALRALPASRRTRVDVDSDAALAALRRLTAGSREAASGGQFMASIFGSRVFGVSVGILLAGLVAVLPLLGPLAAGFTTVALSAGVAGVGFGLVGAAIARLVKGVKDGEEGFIELGIAIEEVKQEALNAFRPAALAAAQFALRLRPLVSQLLPQLGRAALAATNGVIRGFEQAGRQISRTGTTARSFQRILNAIPRILQNLTRGATLFGAGMLNVFRAALPQINAFSRGIRQIGQRFFEWSRTDAARQRIRAFLASAAPVALALARAIGRIGGALIDLGIRHGPAAARAIIAIGNAIAAGINAFSRLLDIVRFLAAQFARLPAPVRSFAQGAFIAASAGLALYNAFRLLRVALAGLAILAGPAGWIVLGLIAVGAALYTAYQHSETFRNGVSRVVAFFNAAWPTIAATAEWVRDVIIAAAGDIWATAGPYFWQLVGYAQQAWNAILSATATYWPQIRDWVLEAAEGVTSWFNANWPAILTIVDWVLWAVMGAVGGFAAFWGGSWDGVKMILEGAVMIIGSLLEGVVKFVGNMVELVAAILNGDWAGAWEAAKSLVSDGMSAMIGVLEGAATIAIGVIRGMAEGIVSWFQWAYDSIVGNSIVPDMVRDVIAEMDTMDEQSSRRADRWATNVIRQMRRVENQPIRLVGVEATELDRVGTQIDSLMSPAAGVPAAAAIAPQNRELDGMRDDFSESFGDIAQVGQTEMEKLHETVVDETKLMRRGMKDETEDLFRDMDRLFKDTYESGEDNFTLLRQKGAEQTTMLNNEASRNMDMAARNMIRSLTDAQQTGNAQLTTLRTHGAATMEAADTEFRYPIGESAQGIQQYLNDMLYGMAQVIDAASLSLTAPEQFQIRLTGAAQGGIIGFDKGGAGEPAAASELLQFAKAGMVGWDDKAGGISSPGQSRLHWWGEGDSEEAYIVKNRPADEQLPYLAEAASWHGYHLLPAQEGHSESFGYAPVVPFQLGGTSYAWAPHVQSYVDDVTTHVGGVPNTYAGHPGGESYSADFWGGGGRGSAIDPGLGDNISDYIHAKATEWALKWIIWWGTMYDPGPSVYSDPSDMHYDHVHATWASEGESGFFGGVGGKPAIDIGKLVNDYFPAELDLGDDLVAQSGEDIGSQVRSAMVDVLQSAVGSWNGGGTLAEWISQGIDFGNAIANNSENISLLTGRAMQESTGDPTAVNNWDINAMNGTPSKGLFQVIGPTWEAHRSMYGADAGDFESNWNNPILSTGVATRYMQNVYGGPVGPGGGGYSEGGIATAMQMALVAEKGPELFIPLNDTRAVQLLFDQIVDWRASKEDFSRVSSSSVTQRFEADNAVVNARLSANTGNQVSRTEIRELGDRLEGALSRQVDARITNVEEMVDVAVQAAVGAQESPAGQQIQARNRAREYENILNRRK